jgi:hypothetical protein
MAATEASTRPRFGLGVRLGCVALTTLIGLLAVELILRLSGVAATGRGSAWFAGGSHPRFLFVENAKAGYSLRPGFEGIEVAASGEFRVAVRIGDDSLRSASELPSPDRPEIVAVGDSMTFGEGVAESDTWTARLQSASRRRVINAGVPGYSSRQMLERLRDELGRRKPEAVLLALSARWDLGRCSDPFVYREGYIVAASYADRLHLVGENLYQEAFSSPWLARPSALATGHSALLRLALPRLAGLGGDDKVGRRAERKSRPGWPTYGPCLEALAAARSESQTRGADFRVVLIDSPTDAFARDTQTLRRRLAEHGVPFVALDDWIREGGRAGLRYPKDLHWNVAGHARVARALGDALPEWFGK